MKGATLRFHRSKSSEHKPLEGLKVLILTKDLDDNSTGRAFVLWELATESGAFAQVVASVGTSVWGPLQSSPEFVQSCAVLPDDPKGKVSLLGLASEADLVIAVKPHPDTLGRAIWLKGELGVPVLADIDDPDLEATLRTGQPLRRLAKRILRPTITRTYRQIRSSLTTANKIVSNPVLFESYGGTIIPHTRRDSGPGTEHSSFSPIVAFIGTDRPHKGVGVLRNAVAQLQDIGVTLIITDEEPANSHPWERWIGRTTLSEGISVTKTSDIIVIPSSGKRLYSRGQLPAKLIDGMMAGRAIVVSDIEPLPWAIMGAGLVVSPDNPRLLAEAIRKLADPELRKVLGKKARERALGEFTVEANLNKFSAACLTALNQENAVGRKDPLFMKFDH